jgi:hypothetical protein
LQVMFLFLLKEIENEKAGSMAETGFCVLAAD